MDLLMLKSGMLKKLIDKHRISKFKIYLRILKDWRKKLNLISFEEEEMWDEVIMDSLTPYFLDLEMFNTKGLIAVDVGTGAGIPGIPMAIVMNSWRFHLVESSKKKVGFLLFALKELNLKNVSVHFERVERFSVLYREKFDIVFERAVAPTPVMIEYSAPLLKVRGSALIYGGRKNLIDVKRGLKHISFLGFEDFKVYWYSLNDKKRCIIHLKKISKTPSEFPRGIGRAMKDPLWR